jgi:hypothetical protein
VLRRCSTTATVNPTGFHSPHSSLAAEAVRARMRRLYSCLGLEIPLNFLISRLNLNSIPSIFFSSSSSPCWRYHSLYQKRKALGKHNSCQGKRFQRYSMHQWLVWEVLAVALGWTWDSYQAAQNAATPGWGVGGSDTSNRPPFFLSHHLRSIRPLSLRAVPLEDIISFWDRCCKAYHSHFPFCWHTKWWLAHGL